MSNQEHAGVFKVEDVLNHKQSRTDEELREDIQGLGLSREDKGLLWSISQTIKEHNGVLVAIGRKLVELVVAVARRFPSTLAGSAIGIGVTWLLYSIPGLGWLLGPLLAPFVIAAPLITGLALDIKSQLVGMLRG